VKPFQSKDWSDRLWKVDIPLWDQDKTKLLEKNNTGVVEIVFLMASERGFVPFPADPPGITKWVGHLKLLEGLIVSLEYLVKDAQATMIAPAFETSESGTEATPTSKIHELMAFILVPIEHTTPFVSECFFLDGQASSQMNDMSYWNQIE
jgi:hypothetical protein